MKRRGLFFALAAMLAFTCTTASAQVFDPTAHPKQPGTSDPIFENQKSPETSFEVDAGASSVNGRLRGLVAIEYKGLTEKGEPGHKTVLLETSITLTYSANGGGSPVPAFEVTVVPYQSFHGDASRDDVTWSWGLGRAIVSKDYNLDRDLQATVSVLRLSGTVFENKNGPISGAEGFVELLGATYLRTLVEDARKTDNTYLHIGSIGASFLTTSRQGRYGDHFDDPIRISGKLVNVKIDYDRWNGQSLTTLDIWSELQIAFKAGSYELVAFTKGGWKSDEYGGPNKPHSDKAHSYVNFGLGGRF